LRAITSETPLFIEPRENARLEAQLLEEKAALKIQKEEVATMVQELEVRGKELAARYEQVQIQKATLKELPEKITELESNIETLREAHPSPTKSRHPNLNLPLPATLALLSERETEISALDSQIRALQTAIPRKTRELDRLESELQPLMTQKKTAVTQAKEARLRREQGGVDEMEQKGRWYRSADTSLREMLGVEN
jgi:DNA repair exonuclease SbcCD ATPase subunit